MPKLHEIYSFNLWIRSSAVTLVANGEKAKKIKDNVAGQYQNDQINTPKEGHE
jgi:hypothetical protein